MDRCAPGYADSTVSCFPKEVLLEIVKIWNSSHPSSMIDLRVGDSKADIWEGIQKALSSQCGDDEACWLEQSFLKGKKEINRYFKPLAPLGRYQWLSTDDIFNVMKQWEEKDPSFKFVGPVPMDFLKLRDPDSRFLQSLDLRKTPYKHVGVIFNMDPSTSGGSHWIAMMFRSAGGGKSVDFFDSYGNLYMYKNMLGAGYTDSSGTSHSAGPKLGIPPEIQKLIGRVTKTPLSGGGRGRKGLNGGFDLKINTVQHQYANSECGVYSMLFLIKSLYKNFEQITQDIVMDEKANQYRDILFRRH